MTSSISFTLNGKRATVNTDPARKLLWVLRTDLALTGTKYGCGEGYCGSCTVHVDGEAVRACALTVGEVRGKTLTTIEGLADKGVLHPVQAAFAKHDALQCGFCTPGMIMQAAALLRADPKSTMENLKAGMEDNLCRCAAHTRIVEALGEVSASPSFGTTEGGE